MGEVQKDGPGIDAWEPWTPHEVASILKGCNAPWCVVGGWAIDLFLGRKSRTHADIEIAVPRMFFDDIRTRLQQFALHAVGGNTRRSIGSKEFPPDKHQCWVLDTSVQKWRLDVMLEPGDRDRWVYRRAPHISEPRNGLVLRNSEGVPFLAPQAVLLFKASGREKDDLDFDNTLPHLSAEARAWLRGALAAHPASAWLEKL